MPTILDLCEVKLPEVKLDGASLLPIIKSESAKSSYSALHWQWGKRWAVRKGDWKLVGRFNESEFLGNLNDPDPEAKNYLKTKPEVVKQLEELHQKWAKDVASQH